jgi:lipoyl(octanoyl) transferase
VNQERENWFSLIHDAAPPAWNMACDEWLLSQAARVNQPVLRTYAWDRPSISIGYFQPWPEGISNAYTIVRRPTGGALVVHDDDLTFTVVLPPSHPWKKLSITERYAKVHQRVETMFGLVGFTAALEPSGLFDASASRAIPSGRSDANTHCFAKHSRYDVLVGGRKVAGGAQRVTHHGLLHQGSIQGPGVDRALISHGALLKAWESFGAKFQPLELRPGDLDAIENLARTKYESTEWNNRMLRRNATTVPSDS